IKRGQIWHGRGCCGIEKQAPRRSALLLIPRSHHIFSAGDFFMRRSFILAGVAITITTLVALFAAHAQQPMQRVQVGVLECRGGASLGFIVGSVTNLRCVPRAGGMPQDPYVATIRHGGLRPGLNHASATAWGPSAPF